MERYLTDESMDRYIPARQRELCLAMKKHSFRNKLQEPQNTKVQEMMKEIVNHMRVCFTFL